MVSLKAMYYAVAATVKGVCERTYYRDRPKSVEAKVSSYLVISFPSAVVNRELDPRGTYNDYSTTLLLEVYVRDQQSASNPTAIDLKAMDEKVSAVLRRFPIDSDVLLATRPEIVMDDDDDSGFHVTLIRARVRTK